MIFTKATTLGTFLQVPTREAGDSIKPGVERSGTPGRLRVTSQAHEVFDSVWLGFDLMRFGLSPVPRAQN